MKRLFLLLLLLPSALLAVTRTLNLSAPSQVYAGESFTVTTSGSTDATDGEQIGFYHAFYSVNGGSQNWFAGDVNAGGSATRNAYITAGSAGSTIMVCAKIAFRGGGAGDVDYAGGAINWGGSWDGNGTPPARVAYISVVAPPNQAPTIAWTVNPGNAWVNEWFNMQARGNDANGNLGNVFVWREWVPHAFNGGGNGYENYSDLNGYAKNSPGTVTFQAQAVDLDNAASPVIYHTVNINNRAPGSITLTLAGTAGLVWDNTNQHYVIDQNTTSTAGNSLTVTANVQDPDSNLAYHTLRYQKVLGANPDNNAWTVVGNETATNGASSTKQGVFTYGSLTPGRWDFNTNGSDGYQSGPGASKTLWVWGSSNGAAFVSQTVPSTATTGDSFSVSITMQNTGDKIWTTDADPHRLGSFNAANNTTWGFSRVALAGGETVYPGASKTFTFNATAPTVPGTYNFQWKMLEETGNYFGAATTNVAITVTDNDAPTVPASLTLAAKTHNSVSLSWGAATDNSGSVTYRVYRGGVLAGTVSGLTFTDSGRTPNTAYSYIVKAFDGTNESAASNTVNVTTDLDPVADQDGDGIPNGWESSHGLNPNVADASLDPDNDGLTNIAEYNLGTDPQVYNQGTSNLGNAVPGGWPNSGINSTIAVGATAGELTVDKSGAATYSVPIWTTPGTAGMQPQVSLNYSSQAGAGIAGFGWSIGGVSTITRGPKTRAVDSVVHGVDFTSADQFYLDGQRLILVSGTHGTAGAVYRTELETFTRVTAVGTRGTGPASFKAQTKAGLTIWFGNSDGSTNDASTFDAYGHTEPFSWSVSRIQDTKGNYMAFTYEEIVNAGEGSQRLTRIDYTGNGGVSPYASLRFEYEARDDAVRGYSGGSPVSNLKRLKAIRSYYGETVARTYTLTYTVRAYTNRSILSSLTEAGSDNKAYPPLNFTYGSTGDTLGWDTAASNFAYEPAYPLADNRTGSTFGTGTGFVDLNGDGRVDFVARRDYNSGVADIQTFALNTGTGWSTTPSGYSYNLPHPLGYVNRGDDTGARFVDFNNDGLVDLVVYKVDANGNYQTQASWQNTGTGWTQVYGNYLLPAPSARDSSSGNDYSKRGGRFMDVNGDGLPDYVCFLTTTPGTNSGKTKLAVYLNNGAGWNSSLSSSYSEAGLPGGSSPDLPDKQVRFVDLNGDGLPDILVSFKNGSTYDKYVALNTGTGWAGTGSNWTPPTWVAESGQPRIGAELMDLNGDGLPDLVWSRETPTVESGYALNTGAGWDASQTIGAFLSPGELGRQNSPGSGVAFTDVNADGQVDILMARYLSGAGAQTAHLGTGAGWQAAPSSMALPENLLVDNWVVGADFVDFDGDGVGDFVWKRWAPTTGNPIQSGVARNKASPLADRLTKVTNGLGVTASITYKTLLDASVYTKGSGGPTGSANLIGPMYVVSTINNDDGAGGQYPVNYKYAGLRSDPLRGSLGFEKMVVTDGRTAIRSETTFRQTYPFTGMAYLSSTITSGGTVLKSSTISYNEKQPNPGTHFIFAEDTVESTNDLNGAAMGTTHTYIPVAATDIDAYGNIKKLVTTIDEFTTTTDSVYTNDDTTTNWQLGRLTSATVTTATPSNSQTRTSSFTYDNGASGLLLSETIEPGNATLGLTTTYTYDQFGNKTSATTSGSGLTVDTSGNYSASGTVSRTTTTQYDSYGRFPSWTKNALNHQENYTGYNQTLGVLTNMTGANGLATSWSYDGFGRKTQETRADGTVTYTTYRWVSGAPAQAQYYGGLATPAVKYSVETQVVSGSTNIASPALSFYDSFGRAFLALSVNGDGNIVYQTTQFDDRSRRAATSVPYLAGGSAYWTVTTAFDDLNRPVTVVTPDDANGNQTTSYSYNGLTVSVTDPKSRVAQTIKNSQGWTSANTRNLNATGGASASTVLYYYDALGNLTSTSADGVTTSLGYDGRGRKTSMTDADMGAWQYRYNVFGELIWQKDAKGQIVTMVYDALGRMTSRTEAEGATTWTYDTATTGIGKLASVSAPAGVASSSYAETYSYDSLGRPISLMRTIDGVNYQTQTTYDGASRPLRTIYPASVSGSISTRNVYNAFGYLKEIRNYLATDDAKPISQLQGRVYWMADSYAVTGQVNGETYGNGLANDRAFSAVTGRLSRATIDRGSVITAPFFVQDLSYTYDAVGNVSRRQESATGYARDEQFYTSTPGDGYDGLDRLKVHKVVGGATVTVTYDTKGNITNKSDVGNYTYSGINAGPHAVTTAGSNTYTYDAVGNMLTGAGRTQDWTSFNQLKKVTQGSLSSEFAFGAGHERVLQVKKNGSTVTDRTIYVGSLFEKVISASGSLTEYKHYIMGPTGRIAVYTERNDLTKDTRWLHTDGLGSVTVVSDENGKVLKRYTYDAWGKQSTQYTNTGGGITNTAPTTRGFTDHEMLTDYGLIHMNGRVYDPVLGRFLSADPNVDGVEDAQGYNRYSYVGNNPMNATDPSGYFSLKDALKIVAIAVVAWFTAGLALQAWAVISTGSGFVGGLAGALASVGTAAGWAGGGWAIAAGVGAGFGASFAGSLLNGGSVGDAFKAGIIGGIVGGISAGIAGKIGDFAKGHEWFRGAGQHLAHGATQGALTELQGGEFRHGFYAAFASSAASGPIRELMPDSMTGRTAAAAIVGGTASAIGGGKFANGAVTAAFTHLFNDEAHAMMSSMGGSEAGAYYPAGSFGPSDYVDRINAAAFDAYVNVVLVPAAAEVAGAATMWGLFRASALGRVFWNGGEFAKDAAQAHAVATGGTTINMTLGGRILGWAEKILPRSWMKPLWTRSSAYFARGAEGPVDLVRSLRSPPMRPDSVWLTTERPILQSQGNPINPVIKP